MMSASGDIRENIEAIEEAYEFMLAYAAQGRAEEGAGADGAQIRTFLIRFSAAVDSIAEALEKITQSNAEAIDFVKGLRIESATIASVLKIMLERENISSEVVDNANGLISVRAYLTSLFFMDKAILR